MCADLTKTVSEEFVPDNRKNEGFSGRRGPGACRWSQQGCISNTFSGSGRWGSTTSVRFRTWTGITDNGLIPGGMKFLFIRVDTVRFFLRRNLFWTACDPAQLEVTLRCVVRCGSLFAAWVFSQKQSPRLLRAISFASSKSAAYSHHVQLLSSLMCPMFRTRLGSSVMFSVRSASAKVLRSWCLAMSRARGPCCATWQPGQHDICNWRCGLFCSKKNESPKWTHHTMYVFGQKGLAIWTAASSFQPGRGAKVVLSLFHWSLFSAGDIVSCEIACTSRVVCLDETFMWGALHWRTSRDSWRRTSASESEKGSHSVIRSERKHLQVGALSHGAPSPWGQFNNGGSSRLREAFVEELIQVVHQYLTSQGAASWVEGLQAVAERSAP